MNEFEVGICSSRGQRPGWSSSASARVWIKGVSGNGWVGVAALKFSGRVGGGVRADSVGMVNLYLLLSRILLSIVHLRGARAA